MINVACIDVSTVGKQEVSDLACPREMEWCLPIATAFVHALRTRGDQALENVQSAEVCGCIR